MKVDLPRDYIALVVEDHQAVRSALCEWIAKAFDRCQVREAGSVEEALRIVESEKVDLVLMDIKLPRMNGIDGTRAVRERSARTNVVVVSNSDDKSHRAAAKEAGVSAFVAKRAIHTELIPILTGLLESTA